jgi:hypothetical protein
MKKNSNKQLSLPSSLLLSSFLQIMLLLSSLLQIPIHVGAFKLSQILVALLVPLSLLQVFLLQIPMPPLLP